VIEVENYDDQIERHLLDSISYNWGAAEMSAEVRSPKEVFNPAAIQRRMSYVGISDEAQFNPLAPDDDTATAPPPDPGGGGTPGSYTANATAGRAYGASGSTHSDSQMYQGYYSSTWGNNRSAIMFDYTAIAAALAGKTITSCSVKFKTQFSYYNAGMTAVIGTHNTASTSRVAYGSLVSVKSNRVKKTSCKAGSTYTVSLGTTIGNEFKAGTAKGIMFGPGPSTSKDYYGYHYLSGIQLIFNYTS
jgi:hypothetical protein